MGAAQAQLVVGYSAGLSDLCEEHERLAFLEGLRLGIMLMTEMAEKGS